MQLMFVIPCYPKVILSCFFLLFGLRKTFYFFENINWNGREQYAINSQSLLSVYISQARYKSSNSITSVRSSRHIRGHEHTSSSCVTSVGAAAEKGSPPWWSRSNIVAPQKWQESQYKLRTKVTLIEDLSYFSL